MRTITNFKYSFIIAALFLCCGCDQLKDLFDPNGVIIYNIYNLQAHLKITNINTGETAEKKSTITIGGNKYDLIVNRSQTLEIEFIPDSEKTEPESEYTIDFELFDIKKTVTQKPYKFQYTIDNDVPNGTYPIKCSAMNSKWQNGSSCKQTMYIKIQQ